MPAKKQILSFPKSEGDVKKLNNQLLRTTDIKKHLKNLHDELDDIKRKYYPVIDEKGLRITPELSGTNSIVDEYSEIIDKIEALRYNLKCAIQAYQKELDNKFTSNVTVRVVKSVKRASKKTKSKKNE